MVETGKLAISIPEAAAALGIAQGSAYEAAARGDIPTVMIGGRKIVPVDLLRQKLGVSPSAETNTDVSAIARNLRIEQLKLERDAIERELALLESQQA